MLLFSSAIIDFITKKIPNALILTGIILGVIYRIFIIKETAVFDVFLGMIMPIMFLFILFLLRMMGAGDIKLLSVVGVFVGLKGIVLIICYSIIFGAFFALVKLFVFKNVKERILYFINFVKSIAEGKYKSITEIDYIGDSPSSQFIIRFSIPILLGTCTWVWRGYV